MSTTNLNIKILLEAARKFLENNPSISEVELTDSLGYKVRLVQYTLLPMSTNTIPYEERQTFTYPMKKQEMDWVIMEKIEGRWLVNGDFTYKLEPKGSCAANGAVIEVNIGKVTYLKQHPRNPVLSPT